MGKIRIPIPIPANSDNWWIWLMVIIGIKILIWGCWYLSKLEKTRQEATQITVQDYEELLKKNALENIRPLQQRQMSDAVKTGYVSSGGTLPDLIIGVDARSKEIGGYCIDLINRTCEYYALTQNQLPWNICENSPTGYSTELEMKNLLFALLLWEKQINQKTRVEIYTGNPNILDATNPHAEGVRKFIVHLNDCCRVGMKCCTVALNQLENYSKFIQPANDLSRNQFQEAIVYLKTIHGVQVKKGAYVDKNEVCQDPYDFLRTVKEAIRRWKQTPCTRAGCNFQLSCTDFLQIE